MSNKKLAPEKAKQFNQQHKLRLAKQRAVKFHAVPLEEAANIDMRVCTDCKIEKPFSEFRRSNYRQHYRRKCKNCDQAALERKREWDRKYYENNSEKIKDRRKKYYKNNFEKVSESNKKWKKNNPEKTKEHRKRYKKNHREKVNEYNRKYRKNNSSFRAAANLRHGERYKNEPLYRLERILRARFTKFLKQNNCRKGGRSFEIFGATPQQIKSHIESQFKDDMTWENQGEWHIDHIIPLDYYFKNFDLNDLEVQKKAFNYKNLQPLWAFENLSKSNKFEKHTQSA